MKNSLSIIESEECQTDIPQRTFPDKTISILDPESIFLLSIGVIPILLHGFMGVVTGSRVPGIWGSIMVSSVGILLFYFLPIKFNKNSFMFFVKLAYVGLLVSLIAVGIFGLFQRKFFIAYPTKTVMTDFDKIWTKKTKNSELKYVAGNMDYVFQFNIYNKNHPRVILETFGYKNPWIDHKDVIKSGAIVVGADDEDVIQRTKQTIYLLPKDYEIIPETYTMDICNKLGKCVKEKFSYVIIPPTKN